LNPKASLGVKVNEEKEKKLDFIGLVIDKYMREACLI